MKRKNPKTGMEFKYGDEREDGKVFRTYTSIVRRDGYFKEVWHSKDTFEKQHLAQKEGAKQWRVARTKKRMLMLNSIKMNAGCAECGYNANPVALDFDHIDPSQKSFDISQKATFAKIHVLLAEIKKCRVLCANCHRIHSSDNGHSRPKSCQSGGDRLSRIVESWGS